MTTDYFITRRRREIIQFLEDENEASLFVNLMGNPQAWIQGNTRCAYHLVNLKMRYG